MVYPLARVKEPTTPKATMESLPIFHFIASSRLPSTLCLSSSQPATTFQKYFPHQTPPKTTNSMQENPQILYYQLVSVSRLASEILRPTCSSLRRAGRAVELSFSFGINGESSKPRSLQFAHIARLGNLGAVVEDGKDAEEEEVEDGKDAEEEEEEKKSYKQGLAPAAREDQGKNSWNDMPKFILAGSVSTIISRTCIAPLERIKLECIVQGSKHPLVKIVQWIWVTEGLRGFWKGNALNLFRMVPFKSINFICYDMYLARLLYVQGKKEITNHDRLIGGGISGVVATTLCIPLDTIRTRLVAPGGEALGGVVGCFFHMVQNEGFLSLYKGLTPALVSMGPASAVFYSVYDMLKVSYLSHRKKMNGDGNELGVMRTLIYGAIAGACAETVTYPLEVIRRQLQLQQSTKLGLASTFIKCIERDGVGSLFAGLIPSTLQVLPSAALSYYFYDKMKSILKIN